MSSCITCKKFILACSLGWGVAAHGMMLFSKLSYHDDMQELYSVGGTTILGRWFLGVLGSLEKLVFGMGNMSLPVVNGLLTILFAGLLCCLIAGMFRIEGKAELAALSGLMVTIPVVTGLFGFMFTAHFYMLGYLLAGAGAWLITREADKDENCLPAGSGEQERKGNASSAGQAGEADDIRAKRKPASSIAAIGTWFGGIAVTACAAGIYQGTLAVTFTLLVLTLLQREVSGAHPAFLKKGLRYLGCGAGAAVLYLIIAKICYAAQHLTVPDYAGLSGVGSTGAGEYLRRIALAYREALLPDRTATYNMFPAHTYTLYLLLLALAAVMSILVLVRMVRTDGNAKRALQCLILIALLPLAMNLIFVLTDAVWIHSLAMYGVTGEFVAVLLLARWVAKISVLQTGRKADDFPKAADRDKRPDRSTDAAKNEAERLEAVNGEPEAAAGSVKWKAWQRSWTKKGKRLSAAVTAILLLLALSYVRYDNICYLKLDFMQEQAKSYMTQLAARIQSADGYEDGMSVVYMNEQSKESAALTGMDEFSCVITQPYTVNTLINDYAWRTFMKMWCGFDPPVWEVDDTFDDRDDVKAIPRYPAPGSVQRIENVMVVKF